MRTPQDIARRDRNRILKMRSFYPALYTFFLCSLVFAESASFEKIYTASTGLGEAYNASSCAECHNFPVLGGSSHMTVTRAGHHDSSGHFSPAPNGGILHTHFANPRYTERLAA